MLVYSFVSSMNYIKGNQITPVTYFNIAGFCGYLLFFLPICFFARLLLSIQHKEAKNLEFLQSWFLENFSTNFNLF